MSSSLASKAEQYIPATVRLISGCKDEQTSADVSNVSSFQLPDVAGKAGGACTSALLQVLYKDHQDTAADLSYEEVVLQLRDNLDDNFTQIPQLSSSRPLDIHGKFHIVPEGSGGTKRAVMIGINYVGHEQGELTGCHNDVKNMKEYLVRVHNFPEDNITLLLDDGEHPPPTRENILAAYDHLVEQCRDGDVVFCHFSGHGGKLKDDNGDENDGYDETLVPLDYKTAGQIRDDDLFKRLVCPLPKNVNMTCLFDCCHSGTVLDLPFVFVGDGEHHEMDSQSNFDFTKFDGGSSAEDDAGNGGGNTQEEDNTTIYDHVYCGAVEGTLHVNDEGLLFQPRDTTTTIPGWTPRNISWKDVSYKEFFHEDVQAGTSAYSTKMTMHNFKLGVIPSKEVTFSFRQHLEEWQRLQCDLDARGYGNPPPPPEVTDSDADYYGWHPEVNYGEMEEEVWWQDEDVDAESHARYMRRQQEHADEQAQQGWSAEDDVAPDTKYYPVHCKDEVGSLVLTKKELQFVPDRHSAAIKKLPWTSFAGRPFCSPFNYPRAQMTIHYHTTRGSVNKKVGFDLDSHNDLVKLEDDVKRRIRACKDAPRERVYVPPKRQPNPMKPYPVKKPMPPQSDISHTEDTTAHYGGGPTIITEANASEPLMANTARRVPYHKDEPRRRLYLLFMSYCCIVTLTGLTFSILFGYFFGPRRPREQYIRTQSPYNIAGDYLGTNPPTPVPAPTPGVRSSSSWSSNSAVLSRDSFLPGTASSAGESGTSNEVAPQRDTDLVLLVNETPATILLPPNFTSMAVDTINNGTTLALTFSDHEDDNNNATLEPTYGGFAEVSKETGSLMTETGPNETVAVPPELSTSAIVPPTTEAPTSMSSATEAPTTGTPTTTVTASVTPAPSTVAPTTGGSVATLAPTAGTTATLPTASETTEPPTEAPTAVSATTAPKTPAPTAVSTRSEETILDLLTDRSFDGGQALRSPGTPQQAAYLLMKVSGLLDEAPSDQVILQKYGMSTLYYAAGGSDWGSGSSTWQDLASSECLKQHIICDEATQETVWIDMPHNNMKGTLPPEIAFMDHLKHISFKDNDLEGTVPTELGLLKNLEFLDLTGNPKLQGTLPPEVRSLPNLTYVKADLP